jgi:hypothetical protein
MELKKGDIVAIRGDKRTNNDGRCSYLNEDMIDGKYLKHIGHGGIWTGKVKSIYDGYALVGGCWRPFDCYEVMCRVVE